MTCEPVYRTIKAELCADAVLGIWLVCNEPKEILHVLQPTVQMKLKVIDQTADEDSIIKGTR